jgi:predicted nucleotidyltransferase
MRINDYEKEVIIEAVKTIDPDAKLWLFGSRVDDNKKGGDIDIAILSEIIRKDVMLEIQVRRHICNKIGEQRIDIVSSVDGKEAIFKLAMEEGILLYG